MTRKLVLCSTSPYRRELLARLGMPFATASPQVDETAIAGESAAALSLRLAVAKAHALADRHPTAVLIGSDQVASLDDALIGKPEHRDAAVAQLLAASGRTVKFHTAIAILDAANGECHTETDLTTVQFRALTRPEIERYLLLEPALDCAGSFKCEGLGISLFDAIETRDPTALIGLPLIATTRLLRQFGINPLT